MYKHDKKYAEELMERHCKNNKIKNPFTRWKIYRDYLKDIKAHPEFYYTKKLTEEI